MAYIRRKQVKGNTYYQLVESYRDGGKVRQRLIMHLGRYQTVEELIVSIEATIESCARTEAIQRARAARYRAPIEDVIQEHYDGVMPPRKRDRDWTWAHTYTRWRMEPAVNGYWKFTLRADEAAAERKATEGRLAELRTVLAAHSVEPCEEHIGTLHEERRAQRAEHEKRLAPLAAGLR